MTERFASAHDVLTGALHHLAFPCAVVEVGDSTHPFWTEAVGTHTFSLDSPAATTDTVFDLASLTKVLSTTTLVMRAFEQGRLDLDGPVGDHLAEWRGSDRAQVTIRDLLSHTSGLPGHRHYYRTVTGGRDGFLTAICAEPLEY